MNFHKGQFWIISVFAVFTLSGCGPSLPQQVADAYEVIPEKIDFNIHVRPILSDRCFACHGPDKNSRKANLRLDTEEGAFSAFDSLGQLIPFIAGDIDHSIAFQRMISDDPEYQMPPPESNLTLEPAEIAIIARWIDQGAKWKDHWAFIPPHKSPLPSVKNPDRVKNEIDQFVLARLESEGLTPAQEADRETLIRRVSFDLTGLPPTIEEIDDFLADESPEAWEKVIDRLLASGHFGEHLAVEWMDVARYADTHGYQADYFRPHWPWRDWVIEAFNRNMPYNEFITWQLAGDLLPNPTKEQILATGFNRNHAQNAEGGIVQEEFRVEYVADRAQTFSTAFLGLTMQCARCHDHKYDPISQKEFYGLFSFFNNVAEAGQITWNTSDMPGPILLLTDEEKDRQIAFLRSQIGGQEKEMESYPNDNRALAENYRKDGPGNIKVHGLIAHYPLESPDVKKITNKLSRIGTGQVVDPVSNRISEDPLVKVKGVSGQALQLDGDMALAFPGVGRFMRSQPFTIGLWAHIPDSLDEGVIFHGNKGAALYTFKGYQVSVENDRFDVRLAHDFPYNAIHLLSNSSVPRNEWIHLTLTYDGSSKAAGVRLFVNGKPLDMEVRRDNLVKDMVFHPVKPGGGYIETYLKVGARWRSRGFTGGKVDEIQVFDRELSQAEVKMVSNQKLTADARDFSKKELDEYYWKAIDDGYQRLADTLETYRTRELLAVEEVMEIMVMDDMKEPRQAYLLERGAYDAPSEEVSAGTPESVLPFTNDYSYDRKGLADWLFDPENPLPARVTVNRFWQRFFGRGIVATAEDFGSQGKLPSHPELLDWLAVDFMANGWDVKYILKKIAMSATYRQSSRTDGDLLERDPDNILLARGPSGRLSAEMLRDHVLAGSGLLVRKLGGPPVKPYQPDGLWDFNRMGGGYQQSEGEDLYRRSCYTYWKRTIPPPAMNILDAPTRAYCVVERQKTTTPLQALVLMNDPQFLEAARKLAERMIREGGETEEGRITIGFRLLTGKSPDKQELMMLKELLAENKEKYQLSPESAAGLLAAGESPVDESLNKEEIAAYTVIATTIMNFDGTLLKR